MGRAPCCDKANVKKGPWSPEEDAKLKAFIEQHGTGGNWIALPQKIGLKRCGKSCRLRWLNYLRPNIKHGGFSEEEDNIICSLYVSIGSRWSIIAAQLPGRTDNDIKNYWNTRLKKKLLGRRRESQSRRSNQENKQVLSSINSASAEALPTNTSSLQTLSASALERMQLHFQLQKLHPFSHFNPLFWSKFQMLGGKLFQTNTLDAEISDSKEAFIPIPTSTTQLETSLLNGFASNSIDLEQTHLSQVLEHQSSAGIDQYENSFNGFSSFGSIGFDGTCNSLDHSVMSKLNSLGQYNMNFQLHSDFPAGLNDLIYCKTGSSLEHEDQLHGLDYFNEMHCTTSESMVWWANGFEHKCSPNPCESTTLVHPGRCQERTLQEYVLEYDL